MCYVNIKLTYAALYFLNVMFCAYTHNLRDVINFTVNLERAQYGIHSKLNSLLADHPAQLFSECDRLFISFCNL